MARPRGDQSHYYPVTTQSVAYTGTAGTITNAVGNYIQVVRVVCTSDAHIAIAVAPTATTSDLPVKADEVEYFSIKPGQKVSAIQQSAGGTLYVTEMTQ